MAVGSSLWMLTLSRVLSGLAAGLATVLTPLYLSDIAPPAIKGAIGERCIPSLQYCLRPR